MAVQWSTIGRDTAPRAIALAVLRLDGFTATHGICPHRIRRPAVGAQCSVPNARCAGGRGMRTVRGA